MNKDGVKLMEFNLDGKLRLRIISHKALGLKNENGKFIHTFTAQK